MKKVILFLLIVCSLFVAAWVIHNKGNRILIGYFHGGRTNMLYRAYLYKYFEKEGVPGVTLVTKDLHDDEVYGVAKQHVRKQVALKKAKDDTFYFGKISGVEIVDYVVEGYFHGGAIGESSFVQCASKGDPIVAVAMLGHDTAESPGKGIILRKGLVINSPQDFKGKTLISRRAGPGDPIFLREFLKDIGMADEKSIKIIDGVPENEAKALLIDGKIDGGLYHLKTLIKLVEKQAAYIYRPMNWMNPELSHALLIFRKDFVDKHPDLVQKVVNAYVKRVHYEKGLPEDQIDRSKDKGLTMKLQFEDMTIAQYDMPPYVRVDLLNRMQELLIEYGYLKKGARLEDFIDNSFVEKAVKEIEANGNKPNGK